MAAFPDEEIARVQVRVEKAILEYHFEEDPGTTLAEFCAINARCIESSYVRYLDAVNPFLCEHA